ncbi:MAG: helix-turn-helix domain-containing protein [Oscillospiraceae bacterium]|jgi:transcriptional regulator with XRE-family HTH domain|nr:helix-turn-helix domain-containing protein [Oscillospiraceae bacterium]
MTFGKKFSLALAYAGISQAELARRLGSSPQTFGYRLKTGKFTHEELEFIAEALGGTYRYEFDFPDGTSI